MNTSLKKTGSVAVGVAMLTGAGVCAVPAQAADITTGVAGTRTLLAPTVKGASSPVIVYRSAAASGRVSIATAPKVAPAKKKAKKKAKSRRS